MIVKENIEIGGRVFVKTYSDSGYYIERDGVRYSEAIDPAEFDRIYVETDMPIEAESDLTLTDALAMLGEMGVNTDD